MLQINQADNLLEHYKRLKEESDQIKKDLEAYRKAILATMDLNNTDCLAGGGFKAQRSFVEQTRIDMAKLSKLIPDWKEVMGKQSTQVRLTVL